MAGVSLVGFSGSLIKDTLHEAAPSLVNFLNPTPATEPPANEPIDEPEATKVVIGICSRVFDYLLLSSRAHQASFSFCLLKSCERRCLILLLCI